MNAKWMLSRRALLGGIGALGLSALTSRTARAATPAAKRFVVFYTPEGLWGRAPRPAPGNGSFGPLFEALEPHRSHVAIFRNLHNPYQIASKNAGRNGDDGHHSGDLEMLSGVSMVGNNEAGGPTVDQVVANAIGGSAPYSAFHLGVRRTTWGEGRYRAFWKAARQRVEPNDDPVSAYNQLFGNFKKADDKFDLRKSVLDGSLRDFDALESSLSSADRVRVEQYHAQLRDIERRLSTTVSCEVPKRPDAINYQDTNRFPEVGRIQMDLLLVALRCGITNVAGIQWGNTNDQTVYSWLGCGQGHAMSHNTNGADPDGSKKLKVRRWYAEQLKYFLDQLAATPEGSGTMLDSTAVLFCSEFGECNGHHASDLTWVLAGNLGGYFKMGRVLDCQGRAVNDLFASICEAFGVSLPNGKFGNPAFCQGPLPLT